MTCEIIKNSETQYRHSILFKIIFLLTTCPSFKTITLRMKSKNLAPTTHPDRYISLPSSVIPAKSMPHNINPPLKLERIK